jgi:hypothetical protein
MEDYHGKVTQKVSKSSTHEIDYTNLFFEDEFSKF